MIQFVIFESSDCNNLHSINLTPIYFEKIRLFLLLRDLEWGDRLNYFTIYG